jgi:hypothetical protein
MSFLSSEPVVRFAANAATVLFGIVIVLQVLLALGILPITMAWGGRQQTLTVALRIASLASVIILGLLIVVIRRRAGLIGGHHIPTMIRVLSWVATAYMALNTMGNLTSVSTTEKIVFTPTSFLLMVSCAIVSLSRTA